MGSAEDFDEAAITNDREPFYAVDSFWSKQSFIKIGAWATCKNVFWKWRYFV